MAFLPPGVGLDGLEGEHELIDRQRGDGTGHRTPRETVDRVIDTTASCTEPLIRSHTATSAWRST